MSRRTEVETWRRLALLLLLFEMTGGLVELYFLEHYEDALQWTPLLSLGAGLMLAGLVALRPTGLAVRLLQVLMSWYLVAAVLGVYLHLESNLEFELELRPSMAGTELVMETLRGAMPAFAPGAMAQLGLLGLLVCHRHPSLAPGDRREANPPEDT
ncbi:MAG TPA: hypothetical protein VK849_03775 [Longimicrobiales bacterium]|nr:hypothetical protein [Longimicrobiales bacterium]